MNRICMTALAAAAMILSSTTSHAVINSIDTTGSTLNSITVDGNLFTFSDLVKGQLTAFDGSASVILLEDGGSVPAAGSRGTLLFDNNIVTGVINPDSGADNVTVQFDSLLVNQPGTDIVLLEFDPSGENGNDQLSVLINGVTNTGASEGTNLAGGFTADVFSGGTGNVDTLAELESTSFSLTSNNTTQNIFGYSIDFSDFGLAEGAKVGSIQFGSGSGATIDPTLVAGLHEFIPVPEPTTALLGLMGLAGIGARRRRQA